MENSKLISEIRQLREERAKGRWFEARTHEVRWPLTTRLGVAKSWVMAHLGIPALPFLCSHQMFNKARHTKKPLRRIDCFH